MDTWDWFMSRKQSVFRHGILLVAKLSQALLGIGDGFVATLRTLLFIDGFRQPKKPFAKEMFLLILGLSLCSDFLRRFLDASRSARNWNHCTRVCQGCAPIWRWHTPDIQWTGVCLIKTFGGFCLRVLHLAVRQLLSYLRPSHLPSSRCYRAGKRRVRLTWHYKRRRFCWS